MYAWALRFSSAEGCPFTHWALYMFPLVAAACLHPLGCMRAPVGAHTYKTHLHHSAPAPPPYRATRIFMRSAGRGWAGWVGLGCVGPGWGCLDGRGDLAGLGGDGRGLGMIRGGLIVLA